jgi:hypothetical protein
MFEVEGTVSADQVPWKAGAGRYAELKKGWVEMGLGSALKVVCEDGKEAERVIGALRDFARAQNPDLRVRAYRERLPGGKVRVYLDKMRRNGRRPG